MPDVQFLPQAELLLACLVEALAINPNPPASACLTWGDPIADIGANGWDCCEGVAFVNMREFYPSNNLFPDRTIERQSGPCGVIAWAVPFQATVFRCWPDDGLNKINCTTRTAAVTQQFHDAQAIRNALCCFRRANRDYLTAITESKPIEPMGGCAGVYGQIAIQLPNCEQC